MFSIVAQTCCCDRVLRPGEYVTELSSWSGQVAGELLLTVLCPLASNHAQQEPGSVHHNSALDVQAEDLSWRNKEQLRRIPRVLNFANTVLTLLGWSLLVICQCYISLAHLNWALVKRHVCALRPNNAISNSRMRLVPRML